MNACACIHTGCAAAGFCIAQNPGRVTSMAAAPVYWREPAQPLICPYCKQPETKWEMRDLMRGSRPMVGGKEYHCMHASVAD